jgi:hypothetical protein
VELPISSTLRQELARTDYDQLDSDIATFERELVERIEQLELLIADLEGRVAAIERKTV